MAINDVKQYGRVGVLFGGASAEREISLKSGQAILESLQDLGVDVVPVDIQEQPVAQIQAANIDTAFIALHGGIGEDGRIQAALELMNIPYTGSDMRASVLAMDKVLSKQLWERLQIPTATFVMLNEKSDFQQMIAHCGEVMVKPAHAGSSIGMSIATTADELQQAFLAASRYDTSVFAEQLLSGGEYTVAVLNGQALPVIKLETDHVFYDYDAKYLADDTSYLCPCGLGEKEENALQQLALDAFNSLQCSGWGRVDIMMDDQDNFNVLEVNTVPGMTDHSLVPMAAKASGYSFQQLVGEILITAKNESPQ